MSSVLDVVLGAGKATANKAIGLPVVCVDLDGVLASYSGTGWQGVESIGEPIPGAVEFMDELSREFSITVFTTRTKADLPARDEEDGDYTPEDLAAIVRDWLDAHQFSYDEVYVGQGKPLAVAYLDDRAVTCVPEEAGQTAYQNAIASARDLAERNKKSLLASAFGVASPALWVARGVWNYQAAIGTKSRLKIRWTTGDPSPNRCKECQSLIGQIVRLGEAFTTAKGRQVYNPPEPHKNCRCRLEVVTGSKSAIFGALGAKSSLFVGKAGESFFSSCERDDQGHCVAGSGSGGAAGSDEAGATGGEAGEPARPDTPFQKWQDRQEKRDNLREAIAGADTSKFEAKELRAAWDAIRGDMSGMSTDETNAKIDAAAAASGDYFDDIVNSLSDLDFDTEKEAAALAKLADKFKAELAKKADAWKKVNEAVDQAIEEKNKLEEAGSGVEEPELDEPDGPEEEEYPDEPDEPDDDGGDEPEPPGRNDTYTGNDALGNPVVDAPMYDDDEEYEDAVSDFKKEHAEWKETNDKYKKDYAQYEKDVAAYEKETAAIDKRNEKAQAAHDKAVEAAEKKYDKEYAAYEKAEEKFEAAVAKANEKISKLQDKAIDLFSEFEEADDEALDALAEKQQEILEAIEAKVDAEEEKDEQPEETDEDADYENAQLDQWRQSDEVKKLRAAELEKYNKEHGEPKSGLAQSVVGLAIAHTLKARHATLDEALAASKPRPRSLRGVRRWLSEWKEIPAAATVVEHFPRVEQKENYTCGAACLSAVAKFYGVEGSEAEEEWFAKKLGTSPQDGTPPPRMINLAKEMGLEVRHSGQMDAAKLRRLVEEGIPVVVLVQAWAK